MTRAPRRREETPEYDRWDLEALYPTLESWEQDFKKTEAFPEKISRWSGMLSESAGQLTSALTLLFQQRRLLARIYAYAHHKRDEDLSVSRHQDMISRITGRTTAYEAAAAFITPELLAVERETMDAWLDTEGLKPYRSWLEDILRFRPHTLKPKEEQLLTLALDPLGGFQRAFSMLDNTDRPQRLPVVADEHGNKIKITNANLNLLLQSRARPVRRGAFQGFYGELKGNTNTLAALLDGQVRTHCFLAKARNYGSAIEASLFRDGVDVVVYDSLISTVHSFLGPFREYLEIKKRRLGLDAMHVYDILTPIADVPDRRFTFDEAKQLTLEASEPLGSEYVEILRGGFDNRWVDRYENIGKRSGAYSGGCYDSYPYILHNFNGTLTSVFTLAHEAGHSMHSWFSWNNQPYHTAKYKILVAEVASITNEMLLVDHLLKSSPEDKERAYLLDHLLSRFRAVIFRQTMFAEFEKRIHEQIEKGDSLTVDYLNDTYFALTKLYHGDVIENDQEDEPIMLEWGRIPHFFYDFYVYKYATGMAAAVDISSRILSREPGVVDDYFSFLKSGASKPPLDLLKDTGVDLTTERPVKSALLRMQELVQELASLV